jgi:hypothetical protein
LINLVVSGPEALISNITLTLVSISPSPTSSSFSLKNKKFHVRKSGNSNNEYLLHVVHVFREDSEEELSLFVCFESGGHNAVGARWQLKAFGNLSQVDE